MDIYAVHSLPELLENNPYPGRGIVIGTTEDGRYNVVAYFIMGRSVNSRNRIFAKEPDGIRTEAFDPSLLSDPSLIIYHPARVYGDTFIITNGNQTDTIRDGLAEGKSFEEALRTREFEPDGPNFTPRISGIVYADGSYWMSILKSADARGSACVRETFEFPALKGIGHFLHTYVTDGNPIPSFVGEPERVAVSGDIDTFTETVWNHLNEANKISLYVRYKDLESGEVSERIINKNK